MLRSPPVSSAASIGLVASSIGTIDDDRRLSPRRRASDHVHGGEGHGNTLEEIDGDVDRDSSSFLINLGSIEQVVIVPDSFEDEELDIVPDVPDSFEDEEVDMVADVLDSFEDEEVDMVADVPDSLGKEQGQGYNDDDNVKPLTAAQLHELYQECHDPFEDHEVDLVADSIRKKKWRFQSKKRGRWNKKHRDKMMMTM